MRSGRDHEPGLSQIRRPFAFIGGERITPAPLASGAHMTPHQSGPFAAGAMLLTLLFASQGCAPAFTDARMLGKGRVEVTRDTSATAGTKRPETSGNMPNLPILHLSSVRHPIQGIGRVSSVCSRLRKRRVRAYRRSQRLMNKTPRRPDVCPGWPREGAADGSDFLGQSGGKPQGIPRGA
jgi:hypothetical protein